jgi:molecular chaperone GrpE
VHRCLTQNHHPFAGPLVIGGPVAIIRNMEENEKYEGIAADQEIPPAQPDQEGLKREMESLKKEYDSVYDRLLRKQAEFENFRKRVDREKSEFAQFASAELMKELLNALDSFDLALRNASGDGSGRENTLRGFELIYKQIQDTLARFGLKPIEAKGKMFDPNYHQAVSTQASSDVEENIVIEEMRKGYTLNGRLLRPAMVTVSVKG